jgi:DNA modification methylase
MPAESVHACITSPPYYGLRDYQIEPSIWGGDQACYHRWEVDLLDRTRATPGVGGSGLTGGGATQAKANRFEKRSSFCQCGAWRGTFGLEPSYQMYVDHAVDIFREVRRVLRPDGTLWLNLGDSYATGAGAVGDSPGGGARGDAWKGYRGDRIGHEGKLGNYKKGAIEGDRGTAMGPMTQPNRMPQPGLKPKDLMGIPWRVAFALQDDGWWLRQDIIWEKPNPMPENIKDRCTKAHEYLFLLSKSERYYFDADAIAEEAVYDGRGQDETGFKSPADFNGKNADGGARNHRKTTSGNKERKPRPGVPEGTGKNQRGSVPWEGASRNKRSVWTVATSPFPEAHFATFPPALVEPCLKAGTGERGCCPKCAAPWERVTRLVDTGLTQKMPDGMATYAGGHTAIHKDGREAGATDNPVMAKQTVGWYPACRCEGDPPLPEFPAPPSRARLADEAAYKVAKAEHRVACAAIDDERQRMCGPLAGRKTAPAVALDPFGGAGTTALVADRLGRDAVLVELNPSYAEMARNRLAGDGGMFCKVVVEAPIKEAAE